MKGQRLGVLAAALFLLPAVQALSAADPPPEPEDYRLDDYRAPTPLTLRGATVVDTAALAALRQASDVVIIDVLHLEPKPARLAPGNIWRPPAHDGIAGAVWLPNVGYGVLPPALLSYFQDALAHLSAGDPTRPLVFYCRAACWMSWNAAKRTLSFGYRHVIWYPDGIEAWQAAGQPVTVLQPYHNGPPEP